MKRKHNDQTFEYTPSQTNSNVGYTWFACNSRKVKIAHETSLTSIQTLFMIISKGDS